MKECTDKERKMLDLLIGMPSEPERTIGDKFIELMEDIRLGYDKEK